MTPRRRDREDEPTRMNEDDEATRVVPLSDRAVPKGTGRTGQESAGAVPLGTLINNNYEVTAVLKAGGMGEVYRGIEIGTGEAVAIKAILPALAEDEAAELLFKREARTLRQLQDAAIVRYYNYVHDTALDRFFLVMEYIDGTTLSDHLLSHGAIAEPDARQLLRRLARGLAEAHARGIVHRDLSPDNVMLPGGRVADAVLIDFGIAKSAMTEGTMHGQFAGKFRFVAPEQLGHFDGAIGPWTDIYGLGLLIAAALAGRPLEMGGTVVEAVAARRTVPDLSHLPEAMRPVLAKLLAPDPGDRPSGMQAVRRLLSEPAEDPVATPRPSAPSRIVPPAPAGADASRDEFVGRGGRGLLLSAALLALIGLGIGFWAQRPQAPAPPAPAPEAAGPDVSTRDGFLAAFDGGPCTLVARVASGPRAGMIAGYSETGARFPGLPAAYEEAFGARPGILSRTVTAPQCAALEFVGALRGRGAQPLRMALGSERLETGGTLSGQIEELGERALWLALVSAGGGVYTLTDRLEPAAEGQAFSIGLTLGDGAGPAPQLLLAVATEAPLATAAAAPDGARAAELLPRIRAEIGDEAASATLGHVLLTPGT
ncbi:serine/threonine-protein kinase [Roseivivax sediminis]|uniref:Serine/threonine protein kinase n=1 Tax=Roseivivax sediminis TaxID=936889 RepID=A0A1I1ZAM3_9RHOB|nr:serine/threonine-protein kinase [Roseivivax sediminis]SFE28612.1 serine/threonine protein kinase [Roseivivax sediminis]